MPCTHCFAPGPQVALPNPAPCRLRWLVITAAVHVLLFPGATPAHAFSSRTGPATHYRLYAINGFGEELLLGETSFRPSAPLSAWPLPYRGGALTISFATAGGLGGGSGRADVTLYDVSGRLVRRVDSGVYPAGHRLVMWDGRDDHGRDVAPGIYFLHTKGDLGYVRAMKVLVLR